MAKIVTDLIEPLDFRYPKLERVSLQTEANVDSIVGQLRDWGCQNTLVVVTRSLAEKAYISGCASALESAGLGGAIFAKSMQHAPLETAIELAAAIKKSNVDSIIAVGGSSVSDTVKTASLLVSYGLVDTTVTIEQLSNALAQDPLRSMGCRLVSIPTTLSGGEFTPVVGISDRATNHKAVLRGTHICSDMVVLAPALASETPDTLWAASGMKLIDHAVERLIARNHNYLIDAQCSQGLPMVLLWLAKSVGDQNSREAIRGVLLQALWLIQSSHGNVGTGLSHALSHQVGGIYGLGHGAGSAIFLPATLRLLFLTGRVNEGRINRLANALGLDQSETLEVDIISKIENIRNQLGLPSTLSQAGLSGIDADLVTAAVLADPTVSGSPGEPFSPDEIAELLRSTA